MITRSRAAEASKRHEILSYDQEEDVVQLTTKKATMNGPDKAKMMEESKVENEAKPNMRKDSGSIALLLFLYVLQGIPLGLAGAMPMLLQTRKIEYKDQAKFSLVFWPFSMKLLWAPIVDTAYLSRFGRRKTWLVPVQYVIGIFMLILSKVRVLKSPLFGGFTLVTGLVVRVFFLCKHYIFYIAQQLLLNEEY